MNAPDLDRLIHERLRRLPAPAAPPALLPRVMSDARAWSRRPWYRRAWLTWPAGWQVASLLVWTAGLAPAAWLTAAAWSMPEFAAIRVLWRALIEPVVPYAFTLMALVCLAATAAAAALSHLVLHSTAGRMAKS